MKLTREGEECVEQLARLHRAELVSLEGESAVPDLALLDDLNDIYRLFRCRTIMNCTEVCPKGLSPSRAIERIRLLLAKESL